MTRGQLTVRAPRAMVWDLLTDPTKTTTYAPAVAHVEVLSGTPGVVGHMVFQTHLRSGQRPVRTQVEVTEAVPCERYRSRGSIGLLAFEARYELRRGPDEGAFREDAEESTLLSWDVDYAPAGPVGWLLTVALLGLPLLQVRAARARFAQVMETLAREAERMATRR